MDNLNRKLQLSVNGEITKLKNEEVDCNRRSLDAFYQLHHYGSSITIQ